MSNLRYKSIVDATGAWLEDVETGQRTRPLIGAKGGTSVPPPSPTEEKLKQANLQLIQKQMSLADQQNVEFESMAPYLYSQLGYNYSKAWSPETQSKITSLAQQQADLQKQLSTMQPSGIRLYSGQILPIGNDPYSVTKRKLDSITGQLKELQATPKAVQLTRMTDEERKALMTPEERQTADIQALANERTLKALQGNLDVDPAVESDIARGESQLRQELIQKLGHGAEGSDSWNRAMAEYNKQMNMVRYSVRHGEMTTADAISSNRAQESMRRQDQILRNLQGNANQYGTVSGTMAGAIGSSEGALSRMYGERMNAADLAMQNRARNDAMTGGYVSGGLGLAGAGIGAAALIAV